MAYEKKSSPFTILLDWFYSDYETPIPEEALQLSPVVILNMFCKLGATTVFLNETTNNFSIYGYSRENCLYTFKKLIMLKGITRAQLSYMKNPKEKSEVVEIHKRMPHLKQRDVTQFLREIEKSPECDGIRESFGLLKVEKTKVKGGAKAAVTGDENVVVVPKKRGRPKKNTS